MAVALDALMTGGNGVDGGDTQQASSTTSMSCTAITVGASATFLVVILVYGHNQNTRTVTWDGVSMTEAVTINNGAAIQTSIFILKNPASGAKTLAATWDQATDVYMGASSWTGTDPTTGYQSADNQSGTTGSSPITVTVPSSSDGATIAAYGNNGAKPTMNFNKIYDEDNGGPGGGASYQLGGSSNGHTFTFGSGSAATWAGIHLISGAPPAHANTNPPKKNQAFYIRIALEDFASPGSYKSSPTLAAGDFKVDIDGAGFNNLATLPQVSPSGIAVYLSLSASEMNGDRITVTCIDQTSPKEWCDEGFVIETTA